MAMTLVERRIKGVPLTLLAVLVLTALLTIFFGAWAVSADAKEQNRSFSFGIASNGPNFAAANSVTYSETGEPGGAILANASAADSWWGKSLLRACPLH